MQFGIFTVGDVTADPTTGTAPTEHERIKATIAIAQKAEEVGLDVFATGQHHNPPFIPSAPTTTLAYIAARTERLILSTSTTLITTTDPVRIAEDYAAGEAHFNLWLGYGAQTLQVAGVSVADWGQGDPAGFPKVTYVGREADAAWRTAANQRIDQYRKGDLTVNVVDSSGEAVPGASVKADMQKHAFKFGGDFRQSGVTDQLRQSVSGSFSFSVLPTGQPGVAASGNGIATLLMGFPTAFTTRDTPALRRTSWYMSGFFQDDWTVNRRLTLNIGVRWETDTPIKDLDDRTNGFDLHQINPVSGTPGVVKFAGVNGWRTLPYDTDQLRDRAWIPAMDSARRGDDGRHPGNPAARELGARLRLGLHIDRVERHPPRREQLSRLGAGASARAVVENRSASRH